MSAICFREPAVDDEDWTVWLVTEECTPYHTGQCIGAGKTKTLATLDAQSELRTQISQLHSSLVKEATT